MGRRIRVPRSVLLGLAAIALLAGVEATAVPSAHPGLLAVVEPWAATAQVSGLRCTALALDSRHVLTARHCAHEDAVVVPGVSLCTSPGWSRPTRGHTGSTAAVPDGDDVATLDVTPMQAPDAITGTPRAGPAVVWAFGIDPATGAAACDARTFQGAVASCPSGTPSSWCLYAPPDEQVCAGASGAPVLQTTAGQWQVVAVVSGGPPCGQPGPVVLAALP